MPRGRAIARYRVDDGKGFRLPEHDPDEIPFRDLRGLRGKALEKGFRELVHRDREALTEAQRMLWAHDRWAVLIVLQAMDAAGKDGVIRHVMSGVNPQGCRVHNFKQPSAEELDHDFLWRTTKALPERGMITIFNRSYYEEVLVVRVHPEHLRAQRLPADLEGSGSDRSDLWRKRYESINAFERHLARNGTVVLKFFLNVSKEEQRKRFLQRIDDREKHWKFSAGDVAERGRWDDYMSAYEEAIRATSTAWAPWHVVPADHKWAARALVAEVVTHTIRRLHDAFPETTPEQKRALAEAKRALEDEDSKPAKGERRRK